MKKEYYRIAAVFAGFIGALWFAKPLREFLNGHSNDTVQNSLVAGIAVRALILLVLWKLVRLLHLERFNGIGERPGNLHALILPAGIVLAGFAGNFGVYLNAGATLLTLFAVSTLLVGFVEELTFRGIILPLFIHANKEGRYAVYLGSFLTSFLFGGVHFINLFREPGNYWGITSQVFFALSIGVFFCGLLLRTGNIIIPALFHGFVNFSFGTGDLKQEAAKQAVCDMDGGANWSSVIPTALFFAFILAGGLYMLRKVEKEEVVGKLEGLRL